MTPRSNGTATSRRQVSCVPHYHGICDVTLTLSDKDILPLNPLPDDRF